MVLTATVTNDNHANGVTWSLTGVGTLSNQTTTSVTYTAPAATTLSQTATVMAVSIKETTKYATSTLAVPQLPTITTGSSALAGSVGTAYSVQLAGSGGISPYIWSVASGSTLPAGLTLSSTGVLSGTPLAGGAGSLASTGGMITKITAARAVTESGSACVIANGFVADLLAIVSGAPTGTLFLPSEHKLGARKRWIRFVSTPKGKLLLDEGAVKHAIALSEEKYCSVAAMLQYSFGLKPEALSVEAAIEAVLQSGKVTADLRPPGPPSTTDQVGEAVCAAIG